MKLYVFVVVLLLIFAGVVYVLVNEEDTTESPEATEQFIENWLQNDNGTIATYIQANTIVDEDLVKGRETLAETVGLEMYYALEKEDQALFDEMYNQLTDYFLEADGFVNWKLDEQGRSDVSSNALIDDVRILYALVEATERWGDEHYMKTAVLIGDYVKKHNVNNGVYTDFYEVKDQYASADIQLSYIDIQGMEVLAEHKLLDAEVVDNTSQILFDAPLDHGFYPKSYNVEEKSYTFTEDVNIIDQGILAYHYAQTGNRSEELLEFIKKEMADRGLVHGMYDRATKKPIVNYESPAIYGFLILYALEIDEDTLGHAIYSRMKEYQVIDKESEYYGGYSITDGNTHIFDNLVPLLAEQAIMKNK